jgi:putative ABC transport system permease protein
MALTSLAVIAAACVVIWVVSGYDALLAQFDAFADEYLGRYQLVVVPDGPRAPLGVMRPVGVPIDPRIVSLMKQDPDVAALDPLAQFEVKKATRVQTPGAPEAATPPRRGRDGRPAQGGAAPASPDAARPLFLPRPALVGSNAGQPPREMIEGKWIDPVHPDRVEGVLTAEAAQQLNAHAEDELLVETERGGHRVKIIGIVGQASMAGGGPRGPSPSRGPATSALYVPIALAEKLAGQPSESRCINVALNEEVDAEAFCKRWNARLAEEKLPAVVLSPNDVEDDLKQGFSAAQVRNQAYAATGISLLAALFVILTTLSMGVDERIRQFAMLRAVALTRLQVAAMIAMESLVLAVVGWLGGLAAGWGLLQITAAIQPDLFTKGTGLGTWAVVLSGLCALGGSLLASIPPAWRATRVSPLEAMAPTTRSQSSRPSMAFVVAGLVLIGINPLLVFVAPMPDQSRYAVYAAVGCTSMALGFVLLVPLAMWITEKLFGPILAAILRLEPHLVAAQLGANVWRTLGTTVALSLGLGLFVAMQTWGYSMLGPFVPGDWMPNALICFTAGGLPDAELDNIAKIDGIIPERLLPLAVEQPKLGTDITGSEERTSVARQDNVIMIGLDPERGLGGVDPMFPLHFVEGNRDDAIKRLKQGRVCIVPDHFAQAAGLGIGDRFTLLPPESPDKPVEYTVAGVVTLPGWHWMTKFSGLRRRSGRSAAMVFASREDVRQDFALDKTNFLWFDTRNDADLDAVGAALQTVAARYPGKSQPVNAQGTWEFAARMFGPTVRVTTADQVRERINTRADSMIWGMSQLPLVTLLVTSLGVVNAVLASVRSRRWEMGVLRAVGLTRFGLVRIILAEAMLIGLVACLASLGFGVMAGWCGVGISQYVSFFGGMATPLVIPWAKLAMGFAATLLLCLAAALWPAITTGRSEPLKLLQAGRVSL